MPADSAAHRLWYHARQERCALRLRSLPFQLACVVLGTILHDIAESRIDITSCRLLTLQVCYNTPAGAASHCVAIQAAAMMDLAGNKIARQQIAMIKVAAPNMALRVIDRAIQAHGAKGVCQDTPLAGSASISRLKCYQPCSFADCGPAFARCALRMVSILSFWNQRSR